MVVAAGIAGTVASSVIGSAMAPSPAPSPTGSNIGNVATGAMGIAGGMLSAQQAEKYGNQEIAIADPFQQYQQQYAGAINNLEAPGGAQQFLSSNPIYQAQVAQGEQGVERAAAATGQNISGNELAAINQLDTASAGNTLQQQFTNLSQLSGISGENMGAAAGALSNTYSNVNSAYQGVGQGIGQLAQGLPALAGAIGSGINGLTGPTYYTNGGEVNNPGSGGTAANGQSYTDALGDLSGYGGGV